jgi:hypothetical protein
LGEIMTGAYRKIPQLDMVIATGHIDRCGAWAFWQGAGAGKLPPEMGTEIGGKEEILKMSLLVTEGIKQLPKAPERVKVVGLLLALEEFDEEKRQLKVKSLSV